MNKMTNDRKVVIWVDDYSRDEVLLENMNIPAEISASGMDSIVAGEGNAQGRRLRANNTIKSVSYTHLTLPTICSV